MKDYAIINTGSKQYMVCEGDVLRVESLDKNKGDEVSFKPVVVKNQNGLITDGDALKDLAVNAVVVRNGRAKKIIVFKMKRRKDERKKIGHRQNFTEVRITKIS